jgi:tryptophan halogenase
MSRRIEKVVVVGGGTAGWMSAALIRRVLGTQVSVEVVESATIGTVGVGEATIPPIQHLNAVLGISESEFLRETCASIKLAISFEGWRVPGESYFHTFGAAGRNHAFCDFQHFWARGLRLGQTRSLWDYDLNYLCCKTGRFGRPRTHDPFLEVPYAYHFDSGLYGQYLRRISEANGVKRTEGLISHALVDPESGHVRTLRLQDGREVHGDLFVDCSGMRGLLIQQQLEVPYDDWSHWLPCDRALAVPSERLPPTVPYTRSIAHQAGWQWQIPLQHRIGNGLVYSSRHISDDEAAATLMANLPAPALAEPRLIRFRTGRVRDTWVKNVCAVGLSGGFLEPLESTSIYLIQSAIVRLLKLFPHAGITQALVDEYNAQSKLEYETIRDFIILHYHVNERPDAGFWRDVRHMDVPERLRDKIKLFRATGRLFQDPNDIFKDASWLQVLVGQGVMPVDHHPIAAAFSPDELTSALSEMAAAKLKGLEGFVSHDDYLAAAVRAQS